jgi:hypothetical protein
MAATMLMGALLHPALAEAVAVVGIILVQALEALVMPARL